MGCDQCFPFGLLLRWATAIALLRAAAGAALRAAASAAQRGGRSSATGCAWRMPCGLLQAAAGASFWFAELY